MLIPFLTWHGTWFGRVLEDPELGQYLVDDERPRRIQHALARIAEEIERDSPQVKRWYPAVSRLSQHSLPEIRITAAWVMGLDAASELFHVTLLGQLQDAQLLVRRNAALSLVRFGDGSGIGELREMLLPLNVLSPTSGRIRYLVEEGVWVSQGTPLVELTASEAVQVKAEISCRVQSLIVPEGSHVKPQAQIMILSPDPSHVRESLRALSLVGGLEVLKLVESISQDPRWEEEIRQQALLTSQTIRQRHAE